ncbi:uncharacterized protein B0I36DRAFT_27431 [Microdochium trichocladiopsis]|uniref:Secreted protein n=1 Tax=Microdochium trichocladiopsis TaxID=1682393 RepID=A0A9P8XXT2_9PEZI|nr:uncharacterized protein B0I36DRAFT_27431 [Microdochium trichocladiopsis]KAH7020970.1 hypothetical protein B0I36DRAFT_27431 [Microdochium trichocladiopsis]
MPHFPSLALVNSAASKLASVLACLPACLLPLQPDRVFTTFTARSFANCAQGPTPDAQAFLYNDDLRNNESTTRRRASTPPTVPVRRGHDRLKSTPPAPVTPRIDTPAHTTVMRHTRSSYAMHVRHLDLSSSTPQLFRTAPSAQCQPRTDSTPNISLEQCLALYCRTPGRHASPFRNTHTARTKPSQANTAENTGAVSASGLAGRLLRIADQHGQACLSLC